LGGDLKEIQSWKDLKLACMNFTAALRGWFSDFPGVYTNEMGFWTFWDMVQKMHEEGVDNSVSQWRREWGHNNRA